LLDPRKKKKSDDERRVENEESEESARYRSNRAGSQALRNLYGTSGERRVTLVVLFSSMFSCGLQMMMYLTNTLFAGKFNPPCLLVDGYNLLFLYDPSRELVEKKDDLGGARQLIEDLMGEYSQAKKMKVLLVWDAYNRSDMSALFECRITTTASGVDVIFCPDAADFYLLSRARELIDEGAAFVTIATSDKEVQDLAFGDNILRASSRELLADVVIQNKERAYALRKIEEDAILNGKGLGKSVSNMVNATSTLRDVRDSLEVNQKLLSSHELARIQQIESQRRKASMRAEPVAVAVPPKQESSRSHKSISTARPASQAQSFGSLSNALSRFASEEAQEGYKEMMEPKAEIVRERRKKPEGRGVRSGGGKKDTTVVQNNKPKRGDGDQKREKRREKQPDSSKRRNEGNHDTEGATTGGKPPLRRPQGKHRQNARPAKDDDHDEGTKE